MKNQLIKADYVRDDVANVEFDLNGKRHVMAVSLSGCEQWLETYPNKKADMYKVHQEALKHARKCVTDAKKQAAEAAAKAAQAAESTTDASGNISAELNVASADSKAN